MAFDYFYRLNRRQQHTYLRSDRLTTVSLTDASGMKPVTGKIEAALADGDQGRTRRHSNELVKLVSADLQVDPARVRVLAKRPSANWGELHGLYEPAETGELGRITVWMRTAQRRQVVAFRTYLRTLLHELCHHLDYELYGLDESFHTEGFFQRESSLVHQLIGKPPAKARRRAR